MPSWAFPVRDQRTYLHLSRLWQTQASEWSPSKCCDETRLSNYVRRRKALPQAQVHPGELKDRVCSPGGTISAMRQLEKNKFRSAVIEAATAAAEKSKQMKKN